jgi:membrane-associated phospholipid phosphatase
VNAASQGHLREGLVALLLALAAFAGLATAYVTGDPLAEFDERIATALHSRAIPPATTVAEVVTLLGGFPALVVVACVAVVLLARRRLRREALLVVLAIVGAQALTGVLKTLFQRERPSFDDPVATAGYFSFPSGHALTAIAVYGAVASIVALRLRSPALRAACLAGAGLLVAAIGFTRLYLGVHYLSDVLAGWSMGLAWLLVAAALVREPWRLPRTRRVAAGAPRIGT